MSLQTPIITLPKKTLDWLKSLPHSDLNSWMEQERYTPIQKLAIVEELNDPLAVNRCKDLMEFMRRAWMEVEDKEFVTGWHLQVIADHLVASLNGKIQNLLINIPPGCCKSLLSCVFFPAWVWTFKPETRFLFASYSQDLSIRDSVKCRQLIESPWYRERFPHVKLVRDENQKQKFSTEAGGWRLATSVGGRGTGEHPDMIIIDDPHKADHSPDVMKSACRWLDGTIASRGRSRGARRIIVMQRLHECDMSAHVANRYDTLCMPMYAEEPRKPTSLGWVDHRKPGELLWPALFTPSMVREMEIDLGPTRAAGQLQQRPAPVDGTMFKREWFQITKHIPTDGEAVRYWDKAGTAGDGDYSAGVLIVKHDGRYFVADVVRGQWASHERNKIIRSTAESDSATYSNYTVWVEEEGGSGGKESAEISARELAGFRVKRERVTGTKVARAGALEGQLGCGNVWLKAAAWNTDYINEFLMFPVGANDDQVDASSGAFNKLAIRRKAIFA